MRSSRMIALAMVVAALGMTGCKNSLKQSNSMLQSEIEDLRAQLAERNTALESCHSELRSAEQQLAQLRRDSDLGVATGFEGIPGVTGTVGAGEVTAIVESDLLFDSGRATLKSSAKNSLNQVASVLNSTYSGKTIRIEGHTDTDPIKKSGYKSNYHLGFERAYTVRDYLISKGVSASRIHLASFGPDVPKGSKAKSRRVEAVVVMN